MHSRQPSPVSRNLRSISLPMQSLLAFEERDRFDVRGMREHVHHAGAGKPEAMLVDQDAGIAGERSGMARYVHHATRRSAREILKHLVRAGAGWVEKDGVVVGPGPGGTALVFEEIGYFESRVADAIARGIGPGALHQAMLALHARHFRHMAGDRQGEVAQA